MPYEFTAEDWSKFTNDIISANGDQATLTTILADMGDTIVTSRTALDESRNAETRIKEENERLKSANMQLFLRVGEQDTGSKQKESYQPPDAETGHSLDTYLDNLFNRKDES